MRAIWPRLCELGVITASRPYAESAGGSSCRAPWPCWPQAYLMAANLGAYGYAGLTTGAAHLIEAFGSRTASKDRFMQRMYGRARAASRHDGADRAAGRQQPGRRPHPRDARDDGTYRDPRRKIFISGGDHDVTENIVHLVLARIDGAPPGIKGISLFAVPRLPPTATARRRAQRRRRRRRHPQDRLPRQSTRPASRRSFTSARRRAAAASSSASPTRASRTCSR